MNGGVQKPNNKGKKKIILVKRPFKSKRGDKNQFWTNLLTGFLIFFILITVYSFIIEERNKTEEITLSQLTQNIKAEQVKKIVVRGDKLEIEYTNETLKESKKEVGSPLSTTLANYGLSAEELEKVDLEIKNQTGFGFWFFGSLPKQVRNTSTFAGIMVALLL